MITLDLTTGQTDEPVALNMTELGAISIKELRGIE